MKKLMALFLVFAGFMGYCQNAADSTYFKVSLLKRDWGQLDVSDITVRLDKRHFKAVLVLSAYDLNSVFKYDYIQNQGKFVSQKVTADTDGGLLAAANDFYHPNNSETLGAAFVVGLFNTIFK